MKLQKIILTTILSVCFLVFLTSPCHAVGTWSERTKIQLMRDDYFKDPTGYKYDFIADATNGSIPALNISDLPGHISAIDIVFDTPVPNTIITNLTSLLGVPLITQRTGNSSYRIYPDDGPIPILGCILLLSGNVTASAKGSVIFYVF